MSKSWLNMSALLCLQFTVIHKNMLELRREPVKKSCQCLFRTNHKRENSKIFCGHHPSRLRSRLWPRNDVFGRTTGRFAAQSRSDPAGQSPRPFNASPFVLDSPFNVCPLAPKLRWFCCSNAYSASNIPITCNTVSMKQIIISLTRP